MSENSTSFALREEALTILIYSLPSADSRVAPQVIFQQTKGSDCTHTNNEPQNVKAIQIKGPFSTRKAITVAFPDTKVAEKVLRKWRFAFFSI